MPAKSKAMRRAAAIAEHHPEQLYPENKGLAEMSKESLHDFAKTKETKLPAHTGRHQTSKHAPFGRKPGARGK